MIILIKQWKSACILKVCSKSTKFPVKDPDGTYNIVSIKSAYNLVSKVKKIDYGKIKSVKRQLERIAVDEFKVKLGK